MSGFAQLWPQLAVFPLRAMREGKCTCGDGAACKSIGKHPAVAWSKLPPRHKCTGADGCPACAEFSYPADGLGIATGARSGIFVVDLDGLDAVRAFGVMGSVPATFAVRRGAERGHLYFKRPAFRVRNSAGEIGPKIDIRGDGGFVVAPESPHKSGDTYEIADDAPVTEAPEWLLKWPGLRQAAASRRHESSSADLLALEQHVGCRVPRAWRVERARVWLATQPAAISGQGGHTAAMRAISCAVRENCLTDASMIREAIAEWNERCDPPWNGAQLEHKICEALFRSTVPWSATLGMTFALASRGAA